MGSKVTASIGEQTALAKGKAAPALPTAPTAPAAPQASPSPSFEAVLNSFKPSSESAIASKPQINSENTKTVLEAALAETAKEKEKAKAIKEIQSQKSAKKYEASLKQAALEKTQAAQAAAKEKYGSYSPFSKSDMPTVSQPKNLYPEYLFQNKTPQYSNFMSAAPATQPASDAYGDALKKTQLEQLLAMIAQSKQPPA